MIRHTCGGKCRPSGVVGRTAGIPAADAAGYNSARPPGVKKVILRGNPATPGGLTEQAPQGRLIFRERQGAASRLDGMATGEPWGSSLLLVTRGARPGPGGAAEL
jgi:hypothetical protein